MIQSTGYEPRAWQRRVHNSLKRFSVLVVHRRGGKTVLSINQLINAALTTDKTMARFAYLAPFLKQARDIAWDYIKAYTSELPVHYNEQTLTVTFPNGAKITLYGADNAEALRGLYFDGIVLDEVADMRPGVWGSIIRPALSDRLGWALFIGTPKGINLFSELYFRALTDEAWYAAVYTVYQTDALAEDEVKEAKADLTPSQFAQEYLCDFHAATENCLMSVSDVEEAMGRRYKQEAYNFAPKVMGVDIACYGNDRSVIARRQGVVSQGHTVWRNVRPMVLASRICQAAEEYQPVAIFIDLGYAPGVCDRVQDLGYPAIGVNFGESAGEERFENKRAEMWWNLADWIKQAALPRDNELITDLCAPTYNLKNRRGKIQLESKDDLRKRGMPSPDLGDAYALTFAEEVMQPINERLHGATPQPHVTSVANDYNPY